MLQMPNMQYPPNIQIVQPSQPLQPLQSLPQNPPLQQCMFTENSAKQGEIIITPINNNKKEDENSGIDNILPLIFISNMMRGLKKKEKPKETSIFDEIKIPDMKKEIRKDIDLFEIDDFVELHFKTLDDIEKKGKEFIKMVEKRNKSLKDKKKIKRISKESKINKYKKEPKDDLDKLKEFLPFIIGEQEEDKSPLAQFFDDISISIGPIKSGNNDVTDDISVDDEIEIDENGLYCFMNKKYSINPKRIMKLVKPLELLNTMVGMSTVKASIFRFISSFIQGNNINSMLNTVIYGGPGLGKTDLGKILCMIYSALEIVPSSKFKLVKASELIGEYVGQTRQKTKDILDEANGGILFIDEVYSLMTGKENTSHSFGKECIDTINQELSEKRRKLVIIIAGYKDEIEERFFAANKGLDRRFPLRYELHAYSKEDMKDIFVRMLRLTDVSLEKNVTDNDIITLFDCMDYFKNYGGDIENLITECTFANHSRSLGKHPSIKDKLTKEDLIEGLKSYKMNREHKDDTSFLRMYT